ncbi:ROK family protein [Taibaiella chishuiensis]|uniref:Glucokinase n=1 Tax=Taibaiella chishuiensis TaxID=1434707 RepID=A0A2P8D069_9BACT|nr:ROK family protein [Taibaiella chishuiensis]PSK90611.1 glucokinase [Taibaiella chishuiensis]
MQSKSFSIGIDIGGTNTAYGIVNRRGEIQEQDRFHTTDYNTPEKFVAALYAKLAPHIAQLDQEAINGIGVGAPNANYYTGEVRLAPNLPWRGVIPLRHLLEEAFGLPVTITNDANATAIGEMTYGSARGMRDFLVVTLGTGVGSGFVANGQLIYGHDGFAGELGHIIAVRDGRPCGCGRNGCLETYASATGIVKTAKAYLEQADQDQVQIEGPGTEDWLIPVWRNTGEVSSSGIHKAALAGDPAAAEIFEFTGKILGQALADAVAITSPEAIILFGGLAKAGDFILKPTKLHMEKNMLAVFQNKIDIVPSGLSERDAAILGAAALAW